MRTEAERGQFPLDFAVSVLHLNDAGGRNPFGAFRLGKTASFTGAVDFGSGELRISREPHGVLDILVIPKTERDR